MDDRLKALLDYTKFHIGLYTTLITAVIAFRKFALGSEHAATRGELWALVTTVVCFLIAGASAGVIATNSFEHTNFEDFRRARLGTWFFAGPTYRWWAAIEHGFFWLGIIVAVAALLSWFR